MWNVGDRTRAEVQAQTLTKAQLAQKTERERCFNAGFDAAIRETTPKEVLRHVHFDHPKYLEDRRARFEQWDLDDRVAQALKTR